MKKFLSIILSILMVVTMLPMAVMPASAATEATDLPTGDVSYYEGVTQYFKYNNYLYKVTWGNYIFNKTDGTKSVKLVVAGNYLACYPNGIALSDYLNKEISGLRATRCTISDLPKTINTSLNCFNEMSSRHIDKTKPIAVITCVGVNAPTWTWSDDKTSANAVFVSADGKAQVTIGVTVTSSTVAAENCQEKDKIIYTAGTTFNGTAYSDVKTEDGAAGPHIYNKEVATESYFKSAATCDNPAVYYKSCVCGACDKSATFNYGSALGHDEEPTYKDSGDGTHSFTCGDCGATVSDNHTGGTATCKEQAKCEHCGASYGELGGHTGGTATCKTQAVCEVCEVSYGELDPDNHEYENNNGFCTECDAYEPAVLNGDVYEISNAGQLYWFSEKVNAGETTINGKLMGNIVVNDGTMTAETTDARAWTPIGNVSNQYTGNFNGNGNTISGLYFNDSSVDNVGLFGYVGVEGKVQNVGVINSYISGKNYVGGVVGVVNDYCTVTNCYNTGTVSGNKYVGGVIGSTYEAVMTDCYNTGAVSGTEYVGGVVGYLRNGTVTGCYNTGAVIGGNEYVGGVAGYSRGTVKNCYNTGAVIGIYHIGGVVGHNDAARGGNVRQCYNIGTVTGRIGGHVGGVVGEGAALKCYYLDTCGATGEGTAKTAEQFKSGEVAYLLNVSKSEGDLVWGQLIGTDSYPVFGGETVYYNESKGYYNLHTCDFSGEWKYDADKHWKECTVDGCSETSEEAEHSYTDGKCDCGYECTHSSYTDGVCDTCDYECPHNYGEGVLTRPERITTTEWDDGFYTYTCSACDHYYQETVKRADYAAYDAVSDDYYAIIMNSSVLGSVKDALKDAVDSLYQNHADVMAGDRIESEQEAVDKVVAELEKIVADAEEKIASGEYVKAEYTEIDEAIDDIEEKLASENVTDEGKAELEEIKKQLEEMKADENTSAADVAELEKALEDYEEELDKGIEDGTLVEIDINKIADEADKKWKERFEAEGLTDEYEDFINNQKATDEALATEKALSDIANSLEGTVAENAENIAKFNEMFDYLFASLENCLRGTHNFKDYEVTSPAKCEVNAIETGTCWFCGETDEREIEGTALSHSFTKYEVTEEAECGKAGKEVAYCDHGCQTTDEKEIAALEHIFLDYVSNGDATCTADGTKTAFCIHGCGATDTVADEDTMLDHTDEDGDKLCDDCGEEVYDRCDICGGKAHGDDKIQILFCIIITIIRFVTSILKSIN